MKPKKKKPASEDLRSLCAEIREDDGIDPREFFREGKGRRRVDRKTLQLCSQIADRLNYLFSSECDDELLQCLQVASVAPAPDATQVLVTVYMSLPPQGDISSNDILRRLSAEAGRIRAEVAQAITRRRAPRLLFQLMANGPGSEDRS
jgi:ribosome-binding factor A